MLVNKRLDLDIANTRLRKAHEAEREARVSNKVLTFTWPLNTYGYIYHTWTDHILSFHLPAFSCLFVRTWMQTRWKTTTCLTSPTCSASCVLNGWRSVTLKGQEHWQAHLNLLFWSLSKSFVLLCLSHPIRCGLRKSLRWVHVYLCMHTGCGVNIHHAVIEGDYFNTASRCRIERGPVSCNNSFLSIVHLELSPSGIWFLFC